MTQLAAQQSPITIATYRPEFCDDIGALIVGIQRNEFNIPITYEDQPDLKKIPQEYQKGGGNFWMALDNGKLVGTVALLDVGSHIGVLKKMFVQKEYRNLGIAKMLLDMLLNSAREHAIQDIFLGTVSATLVAQDFYKKNSFVEIAVEQLPEPVERIRMKIDTLFFHRKTS